MATSVIIVCNAATERVFRAGVDISRNIRFAVFFDLDNPGTRSETRKLRVVNLQTNAELVINLSEAGGLKPSNGIKTPHKPDEHPVIREDVECILEEERVFFKDTNLSADQGVEVTFNIIPFFPNDFRKDKRRFLLFKIANEQIFAGLNGKEIDLTTDGGKKPLEGPIEILQDIPDIRLETNKY